ncbi:hypothetical protein B0T14DRAFT_563305 [Immersiella caudata]|uniref:Uncharacterized protein n=1 Tax=Immersiella caudata TaxID=314043 RepID=A0AA40C6Z9_9PEZI|nr:hypothetical protein B0T14DRAFT_563305 [Immersiella caudata]
MYSAPYGYPNPAGGPAFNGAPPQQNPHLQPGPSPGQPQQMMYNPQQFPMGAQGGHFPAGPNPAMMGGAGPAGMMQNTAMPHMGANGQMAYQTPYTTSPYGAGVPSSAAAPQVQLPGNYMMTGSMATTMAGAMAPFPMNQGMPQQQPMMQRMHPQQNPAGMNASTPQRPGPFNPSQGTPNNAMPPQASQFSTPQPHSAPQSQTPTNAQQQQPPSAAATPQTPTFPTTGQNPQVNGTASVSTPQSPATESREKERFALLLDINQELLYELVSLTNSKAELKKEQAAVESGGSRSDVDPIEEEKLSSVDYGHCIRRLHTNLAYMAALADKKSVQAPPCPAYLMPPPLNLKLKLRVPQSAPDGATEAPPDPNSDRGERVQLLNDLYKKLQALFPGVDPRKEPPPQPQNPRPMPPGAQQMNPGMMKSQNGQMMGAPNGSPVPGPQTQRTPQMANAAAPMMPVGLPGP